MSIYSGHLYRVLVERTKSVLKFSTRYFPFSTCIRIDQGQERVGHSFELSEGI